MIKVILKNNTQVEFDNPKEASQFLHSLYWRDFQHGDVVVPPPVRSEGMQETRCIICGTMLPKFNKKLCGKPECAKENTRRWARKYFKKNRERILANQKSSYEKNELKVNEVANQPEFVKL